MIETEQLQQERTNIVQATAIRVNELITEMYPDQDRLSAISATMSEIDPRICRHCLIHALYEGEQLPNRTYTNLALHLVKSNAIHDMGYPEVIKAVLNESGTEANINYTTAEAYSTLFGLRPEELSSEEYRELQRQNALRLVEIGSIKPINYQDKYSLGIRLGYSPVQIEEMELAQLATEFHTHANELQRRKGEQIAEVLYQKYNAKGEEQSFSRQQLEDIWGITEDIYRLYLKQLADQDQDQWDYSNYVIVDTTYGSGFPTKWFKASFIKQLVSKMGLLDVAISPEAAKIQLDPYFQLDVTDDLTRAQQGRYQILLAEESFRSQGFVTVSELQNAYPTITNSELEKRYIGNKHNSYNMIQRYYAGGRVFLDPYEVVEALPENRVVALQLDPKQLQEWHELREQGWATVTEIIRDHPHISAIQLHTARENSKIDYRDINGRYLIDTAQVLSEFPNLEEDETTLVNAISQIVELHPEDIGSKRERAIQLSYLKYLMIKRQEDPHFSQKKYKGDNVVMFSEFKIWYEEKYRYTRDVNPYNPYADMGYLTSYEVKALLKSWFASLDESVSTTLAEQRNIFIKGLSTYAEVKDSSIKPKQKLKIPAFRKIVQTTEAEQSLLYYSAQKLIEVLETKLGIICPEDIKAEYLKI